MDRYIYCITDNPDRKVNFGEGYYRDYLSSIGAHFVKALNKEGCCKPLQYLDVMLRDMGAIINYGTIGSDVYLSFRFDAVETVKQDYFRPKLDEFRMQAEKLTLSDIINSAQYFDCIFNNNHGSMIAMFNECKEYTATMDDFIRRLEPGATYYVRNDVLLINGVRPLLPLNSRVTSGAPLPRK